MSKRKISIASPAYNEEGNIREFYDRVTAVIDRIPEYDFEIVISDNCSTDKTPEILRELAANDKRLKVILNARNFGHIRSPFNGMLQCTGDAVIVLVSDLQEPPELIPELIRNWEDGYKVVTCVKESSAESPVMYFLRRVFYWAIQRFSDSAEMIQNFNGFGMYDRQFMDALRRYRDPYPYFRGLVSEIGFERAVVKFEQPLRKRGLSKNNLFTLYDAAMSGFVNHSKLPLRLAAFVGFSVAMLSLLMAGIYLAYKLLYWDTFSLGIAPAVVGLFFFSAVQLIFIGVIGEYIGAIFTQVKQWPLVIEKERINFTDDDQ